MIEGGKVIKMLLVCYSMVFVGMNDGILFLVMSVFVFLILLLLFVLIVVDFVWVESMVVEFCDFEFIFVNLVDNIVEVIIVGI